MEGAVSTPLPLVEDRGCGLTFENFHGFRLDLGASEKASTHSVVAVRKHRRFHPGFGENCQGLADVE